MNKFISCLILFHFFYFIKCQESDLTIVGPVKFDDGIFRLSITWIEQLKEDLNIDFKSTGYVNLKGVSKSISEIILNSSKNKRNTKIKKVSVLLSSPWTIGMTHADHVPTSYIKIAYSMLESTEIPQKWVDIFNERFDSVVVPDEFLVEVYKNCGVKIPIFVLPIALILNDFLNKPLKVKANKPFKFGTSATFSDGKNHENVVQAFMNVFANNKDVHLYLHGRAGDDSKIRNLIHKSGIKNIHIINKSLTHSEYVKFLSSLDCYILLSKGEGFSITPREVMALGVPCILSDNTAQKSVCRTGLVEKVKSEILEPAYYTIFDSVVGYKFNNSIHDASQAMKKVFDNYSFYLNKSELMRKWAQSYDYKVLKSKYLTLVKPKKVILGNENYIGDDVLVTDSFELYTKYLKLIK